ncbi:MULTISPECIES: hypothetical protein [Sorangium]|uniref:hypothetical protein n=1 Tax=Sorangium TaxID=39643 RepID=UPI00101AADA9|nr:MULTISPECIES: hypothetical protein [Sorangium]
MGAASTAIQPLAAEVLRPWEASLELARLIARWSTGAAAAPEIQPLAAQVIAPLGSSAISSEW